MSVIKAPMENFDAARRGIWSAYTVYRVDCTLDVYLHCSLSGYIDIQGDAISDNL